MAKSTEQKLVSILAQLPGKAVAVGARGGDATDPAMDYLVKSISPGRAPTGEVGGGGRPNPLAEAMRGRPAKAKSRKPSDNPLAKVLGAK